MSNVYRRRTAHYKVWCGADYIISKNTKDLEALVVPINPCGGIREVVFKDPNTLWIPPTWGHLRVTGLLRFPVDKLRRILWRTTLDETNESWHLLWSVSEEELAKVGFYPYWASVAALLETHIKDWASQEEINNFGDKTMA